jgi:alkanesulfonate monooxygenase SsuD/methylene tetrahydromethanopterin reductase-like flavin-dependent oxidoreductase (luciferase family)
MWTEAYPTFKGTYYTIDRPINEPKGVQKPHPPLWIGGSGERVTLRLVAQFGDACNVGGDPDTIRHKLAVLRQHCETVGRNYDDIVKSAEAEVLVIGRGDDPEQARARARRYGGFREGTVVADADNVAAHLRTLIEAGIDYFIIYIPGVAYDQEPLHRFETEVIPQLAGATPVHSTTR